jgi:hypothetical protein
MRVRWPPRSTPCCTPNFAASLSPCLHLPPPGEAVIGSLTAPPSRKPLSRNVGHSFIVPVMKPVVYVPWYQVLPWILSGGAFS